MHMDATYIRSEEKASCFQAFTNGKQVLYTFSPVKRDKAIEGTPLEAYGRTVIYDHDRTLFNVWQSPPEMHVR